MTRFQQALHLFRIIPENKLVPDLYNGSAEVSGLVDDHGSGRIVGNQIDLFEFHMLCREEFLDLMAVMTMRR